MNLPRSQSSDFNPSTARLMLATDAPLFATHHFQQCLDVRNTDAMRMNALFIGSNFSSAFSSCRRTYFKSDTFQDHVPDKPKIMDCSDAATSARCRPDSLLRDALVPNFRPVMQINNCPVQSRRGRFTADLTDRDPWRAHRRGASQRTQHRGTWNPSGLTKAVDTAMCMTSKRIDVMPFQKHGGVGIIVSMWFTDIDETLQDNSQPGRA
ncbi:hypothetical protein B0H65DRAFT_444979 [Neurospora tetraspora]|uniref:Uncharacterized protein n=1 Tax=Neurospora tetraspora TaxID=94610 RepID=A0AAE0MQN8_9PEZI|nr:hypothetical protein B0H65DRAFT_444979 [Neurospora tetraspora]